MSPPQKDLLDHLILKKQPLSSYSLYFSEQYYHLTSCYMATYSLPVALQNVHFICAETIHCCVHNVV